MNLKNSKFFKRIQYLRHISKDKLRNLEREREKPYGAKLDAVLEHVFQEPNGNGIEAGSAGERLSGGGGGDRLRNVASNRRIVRAKSKTKVINVRLVPPKGDKVHPIPPHKVDKVHPIPPHKGDKERLAAVPSLTTDYTANGLIQLNSVCFRVNCPQVKRSRPARLGENGGKTTLSGCGGGGVSKGGISRGTICVCHSRYGMIGKVSKSIGYKVVRDSKLWNVLWMDSLPGVELYKTMKRFQQINHFPGMMEICRKDLLSRNLNRMLKLFPRDYKVFPKTWIFPADYGEALNYASNCSKFRPRTFIIKPDSGAQGRGIWLTNDLKTINPSERMICQTYIEKPLLIDGYKFDLRVYTLITSVDPLRIFVFNEGLARFATSKYDEPTAENNNDLFMHLTNYSVNKRNSQYELCVDDDCGSKRTFSAINHWMECRKYDIVQFWARIDDIIVKTVLSAWPMLKHNYHACFPAHDRIQACFEVLGFDILVDSKLKPYILEVNHSPSFHTQEPVDRQVKRALIRDTLTLVASALVDKRQILREDRKRVKQRLLKTKQSESSSQARTACESTDDNLTDGGPLSPLSLQIAWEESHLGDFRRIMPPHDPAKLNYYCQFYALQNQASIYGDTAASKKREEVAKKQRLELEAKRAKQLELLNNIGHMKFEDRRRRRATLSRTAVEKHLKQSYRQQAHWLPGFISEAEERLRRTWMQMRVELLRNARVVQMVYLFLHNAGCLTNADVVNYPQLHEKLANGCDITAEDL